MMLGTIGEGTFHAVPLHGLGIECSLNAPPLVGVVMGLFAIPALVEPAIRNTSISRVPADPSRGGILQGVRDVLRHWWLMLNRHRVPVSGRVSGPLRCRSRRKMRPLPSSGIQGNAGRRSGGARNQSWASSS